VIKEKKRPTFTKFKVKAGIHNDGIRTYQRGETLVSDKPLHKVFKNKFDIVALNVPAPVEKSGKKKTKTIRMQVEEMGKKVTVKFPDALRNSMNVYLTDDGEYNVTDEDDPYTPLNKKPMSRIETKKFLGSQ